MMMWQMMMSQFGNQNGQNNGMSMLPFMMMPSDPNNPNSANKIDPNIMSNMMMNQMMQNFSLGGNKDEDR
jgi:hypothetical protein